MDFKKLLQTIQHFEEGVNTPIEECGEEMPTVIQSGQSSDDSLNMNLTINSKGVSGLRDLLDVLKGIDGNDNHSNQSNDAEKLFGTDDSAIVIGDSFENDADSSHEYDVDTLINQGDKKSREASMVNGGGNPQVHESLYQHLRSLYEDVKTRLGEDMSPEEKEAAINAFFAKGGSVTHGKSKRLKKDKIARLLPGEDESGIRHSADAKLPPKRASRHDTVDVPSSGPADWEKALDALQALGRKNKEKDAADKAERDELRSRHNDELDSHRRSKKDHADNEYNRKMSDPEEFRKMKNSHNELMRLNRSLVKDL